MKSDLEIENAGPLTLLGCCASLAGYIIGALESRFRKRHPCGERVVGGPADRAPDHARARNVHSATIDRTTPSLRHASSGIFSS
jgi:hypothetical protein